MKKFFKKASTYLITMLIIAGLLFALNYYYGEKIAVDLEEDIREAALANNYQIRNLSISSNPLFQSVNIERLNLIKVDSYNLDLNGAHFNLSWQQIIYFIQNGDLSLKKDYSAEVDDILYSDLKNDYRLNFQQSVINYQGSFELENLDNVEDIFANDHSLEFKAENLKYDYPYYRTYGITQKSWNELSSFDNFLIRADFSAAEKMLSIKEFILEGQYISYSADLYGEIMRVEARQKEDDSISSNENNSVGENSESQNSINNQNSNDDNNLNTTPSENKNSLKTTELSENFLSEYIFKNLKVNYDFKFNGQGLKTEANDYFKDMSFDNYSFKGYFDIFLPEPEQSLQYSANQMDIEMDLQNFNLTFTDELSREINRNTYGIFAAEDNFSLKIDSFLYEQEYINPGGTTNSRLITPIFNAILDAEYTYTRDEFYLASAELRVKPNTQQAEKLLNFIQLLADRQFTKDEEGYYVIEFYGDIGNLKIN